jgi:hypothetical protein
MVVHSTEEIVYRHLLPRNKPSFRGGREAKVNISLRPVSPTANGSQPSLPLLPRLLRSFINGLEILTQHDPIPFPHVYRNP